MDDDSDVLTLLEDEPSAVVSHSVRWKVAVVDDDPAVHDGTRFALDGYSLHGRGLDLFSARSAREARDLFRAHPDLAVLAGSGCYSGMAASGGPLEPDLRRVIETVFAGRRHQFSPGRSLLYIGTGTGRELIVLLEAEKQLSDTNKALLEVFCSRL